MIKREFTHEAASLLDGKDGKDIALFFSLLAFESFRDTAFTPTMKRIADEKAEIVRRVLERQAGRRVRRLLTEHDLTKKEVGQ